MIESAERIMQYVKDGRDAFLASSLIQDATIRNFETIGEAAKQISAELRRAYPEIPWREVVGFRDVLIHDYLRVDVDEVWNIVESDLPELKQKLGAILSGLPPNS
ncbi:MAG: DUF86 domain-containing protein [candidate division WOR-3 bacterium]|nr:DUF86 domain-containing protein [candidate division WOR-3 bacterium]